MKRRAFITLLGSAVAVPILSPRSARAQQPGRLPTIGYLGATTRAVESQQLAAFEQRLRELGWIDGRNVAIAYRWVEGRSEGSAEMAAELVQLKVDVIVTWGTANIVAAKQATAAVPIVFSAAADPVGMGLVASLARPGGNATGLSILALDLAGKRLELLREVVPNLRRLAIIAHIGGLGAMLEMAEVQTSARALDLDVTALELRGADDIPPAFETLKGRADALFVCVDPLTNTHRAAITNLAIGARLPTMYGQQLYVTAGGLMSYGPSIVDLFRRAGDYVDMILRGAKPGDLPVEQPTKFDLAINLTTAKALGLKIPESFLLRADEVIE
jgi:putative ABC transport system substrate-binding protein